MASSSGIIGRVEITVKHYPERDLLWAPTREGGLASPPAYPGDVGVDLSTVEDIEVPPGRVVYAALGVAFAPPPDCWLMLAGRSSTASKLGLATIPGIIDPGYRGEMFAGVYQAGGFDFEMLTERVLHVPAGSTIAQAILIPAIFPRLVHQDELPPSARGQNGFGSSGAARSTSPVAQEQPTEAPRAPGGLASLPGPGEATETPPVPRWCVVHQAKEVTDPHRRGRCFYGDPTQCLLEEVMP